MRQSIKRIPQLDPQIKLNELQIRNGDKIEEFYSITFFRLVASL